MRWQDDVAHRPPVRVLQIFSSSSLLFSTLELGDTTIYVPYIRAPTPSIRHFPIRAKPCTLHPAPCTLHPAPCTLHHAPQSPDLHTKPANPDTRNLLLQNGDVLLYKTLTCDNTQVQCGGVPGGDDQAPDKPHASPPPEQQPGLHPRRNRYFTLLSHRRCL